jgi:hypothetical protein
MPAEPPESASPRSSLRRRGRPPGSVSLTAETEQIIVTYIRAGAFAHVAAQAAGISPRTFFDWMARGRGTHATRGSTPKLRTFARKVEQAAAEARVAAEVRVYREHPKHWLRYAARTRPGEEGWTEVKADPTASGGDTLENRLRELYFQEAVRERDEHVNSCEDPECLSPLHHRSFEDETGPIEPLDPSFLQSD